MTYELPDEDRESYETALRFSQDEALLRAFGEATRDPDRFAKAGAEILAEYGVEVPEGLTVGITVGGDEGRPVPDGWYPWTIVLSNCRTFRRRSGREVEEATICLSFTIVRTPVPGGPIG